MEMKRGKIFLIFVIVLFLTLLPITSAAHFIIGQVDDSLDLFNADGRTVVLWNPSNSPSDNVTDIIGPSGNSGSSNIYMIDCELLSSSCDVGDVLSLSVINFGDNRFTETINVSVTGSGFDLASNLRLNSLPNVELVYPSNYSNLSSSFDFTCNASDLDGNLANISLYGNWSGTFSLNETNTVLGFYNSSIFSVDLAEGRYSWSCLASDSLGVSIMSSSNHTFNFDPNPPVISAIYANTTSICGDNNYLRVYCNVTDSFIGIDKVIIRSNSPLSSQNYLANLLTGNSYYIDLLASQEGIWNFTCYANDTFSNFANLTSTNINITNGSADFSIVYQDILFDKNTYIENELVNISATINNLGCSDSNGIITSFFYGDPNLGGIQIQNNLSLNIAPYGNVGASVVWPANINLNNIFVVVDINDSFSESSESNNVANNSFLVSSWHVYYGKLNNDKVLANYNFQNLTYWLNDSNVSGNVYVTDIESNIDWSNLYPIGINKSLGNTNDDFFEIDSLLDTSTYNDSVANMFTSDGNSPIQEDSFLVHHNTINNVPIINSTNTSNFVTGILWDASKDNDGQYSISDDEDLIFLTKVNKNSQGMYGTYDYEINIPVKLRSYYTSNQNDVYIYFDLY